MPKKNSNELFCREWRKNQFSVQWILRRNFYLHLKLSRLENDFYDMMWNSFDKQFVVCRCSRGFYSKSHLRCWYDGFSLLNHLTQNLSWKAEKLSSYENLLAKENISSTKICVSKKPKKTFFTWLLFEKQPREVCIRITHKILENLKSKCLFYEPRKLFFVFSEEFSFLFFLLPFTLLGWERE